MYQRPFVSRGGTATRVGIGGQHEIVQVKRRSVDLRDLDLSQTTEVAGSPVTVDHVIASAIVVSNNPRTGNKIQTKSIFCIIINVSPDNRVIRGLRRAAGQIDRTAGEIDDSGRAEPASTR